MPQPITQMSGLNPEVQQEQAVPVFNRDIHNQTLEFQMAEIPTNQTANYPQINPDVIAVVAEIDAADPNNRLIVCQDKQAKEGESRYFVANASMDKLNEDGKYDYRLVAGPTLEPGKPLEFGRESIGDVRTSGLVSRKHLTLEVTPDGRLSVADHSTHGSAVHYAEGQAPAAQVEGQAEAEVPQEEVEVVQPTVEAYKGSGRTLNENLDFLRNDEAHKELGTNFAAAIPKLLEQIHKDSTGEVPETSNHWVAEGVIGEDGKRTLKATFVTGKEGGFKPNSYTTAHLKSFEIDLDQNNMPVGDSIKFAMELWNPQGMKTREQAGVRLEVNNGQFVANHTSTHLDIPAPYPTRPFEKMVTQVGLQGYSADANLANAAKALEVFASPQQ